MPARLYANGLTTRLTAGISAGATSVAITSGDGANWAAANGSDWYIAVLREMSGAKAIASEIVKVTNRSSDTLTIARAQEGSSARAFSEGAILDVDFTAASLQPNTVRAYRSTNQSISNGALTVITFDSERWDTAAMHSTSSNTSRLTCVNPGLHIISGSVEFASGAGAGRQVAILLNGAAYIAAKFITPASGAATRMDITAQYMLAAGDYVELEVYQDSGGSLNVVSAANYSPELTMTRIPG